MTAATAERTVDKALNTGATEQRIQAARAQHAIVNQDAIDFAERVGEMLVRSLNGDLAMGRTAMLQIKMRRQDEVVAE